MAKININVNAYFTLKTPKHIREDYRDSSEALWFSSADALEYIKSTGLRKHVYIGLIGYEDLYIFKTGEIYGVGALCELAKSAHVSRESRNEFKNIFDMAKKVFEESRESLPNYENVLYQFSKEDTLSLVSLVFSDIKYNINCVE